MTLFAEIRRDETLRRLPLWISACVGVALLLSAWFAYRAYGGDPASGSSTLTLVLWCAVAPFLAFGQAGGRCSRFDLALPLSARRLWLAHVAAVLLAAGLILAVAAALVVAISGLSGRLQGLPPPPLDVLRLTVHLGAGLALALAVLESQKPTLVKIPPSRGRVLLTVASLGGILGSLWLLSALPLPWTLVPLGLAVALGLRTYRSLPAAFALVPRAADPDRPPARRSAESDWAAATPRSRWRRDLDLVRWVAGGPIAWLAYPAVFFAGMLVADLLRTLTGETDLTVHNLLLAVYVLLAFSGLMTVRLPHFDPLPVSRRLLYAALVLPSLAAFVLGYGAGRITAVVLEPPRDAGPAFPVFLALVAPPWLLLFSIVLRTYRAGVRDWVRLTVFWGLLSLVFAVMVLQIALAVTDVLEPSVTRRFLEIAIRHLGESWPGTLAAWLGSALALLGGYRLAEAAFCRVELPPRLVMKRGLIDLIGRS